MDESSAILQLEAVVEKLIRKYQVLQAERDSVVSDLASRNAEISSLQGEVDQLKSERENVHGRVSSLLGKLEDWEKGQDGIGGQQQAAAGQTDTASDAPAKLFSMEG